MANTRREPVSYQPFRTRPLLADGLIEVNREGGDVQRRAAQALFRIADEAGQRADRQAGRAGALDGEQAELASAPAATVSGAEQPIGETGAVAKGGRHDQLAAAGKAYLMRNYGVSNEFAAGLLGQFSGESGFNAAAINRGDGTDGSDSIGIGQWNGRRGRALRAFAAQRGKPVTDFYTQLDFAMHELKTSEAPVGRRLAAARTVEEAVAAGVGYERPGGWTPDNPAASNGWNHRLAAGRRIAGLAVDGAPAPAAPAAPSVALTGGGWRPSGADTVYGRAYDEAGSRVYLQQLDAEIRSTTGQLFERYRDDPAGLTKAYGDLKGQLAKDHVFPEIMADYSTGFDSVAERYLGQARENLARKREAEQRAAFVDQGNALATSQQRQIENFDGDSAAAADAIASSQQAIDAHYDAGVRAGIIDPADAATAKIKGRRETALAFYGRQAEALDAAGVAAMRAEMQADFAEGGIEGLDGEGWTNLDAKLTALEEQKRVDAAQAAAALEDRGAAQVARVTAGFEPDPAEMMKLRTDAGGAKNGQDLMASVESRITAARVIRNKPLEESRAYVEDLRKKLGTNPTTGELATVAFAEDQLAKTEEMIKADPAGYDMATGKIQLEPIDTTSRDTLAASLARRGAQMAEVARRHGTPLTIFRPEERSFLARGMTERPELFPEFALVLRQSLGSAAATALGEISPDAPVLAHASGLTLATGDASVARDLAEGIADRARGLYKVKMPGEGKFALAFGAIVGDALATQPQTRAATLATATALFEREANLKGFDPGEIGTEGSPAQQAFAHALDRSLGGRIIGGRKLGGLGEVNGRQIVVPPTMTPEEPQQLVATLNDEDLKALPPILSANGIPIAAEALHGAQLVTVGDGLYNVALGDPDGLDPRWIMGADGDYWQLDIRKLAARTRARTPAPLPMNKGNFQ